MRKVPKKNISKHMSDIVRPGRDHNQQEAHEFIPQEKQGNNAFSGFIATTGASHDDLKRSPFSFTRFAVIFIILGVGILGFAGHRAYQARQEMIASLENQSGTLERFIESPNSNTLSTGTSESLGTRNEVDQPFSNYRTASPSSLGYERASISSIFSALKDAGSSYRDFQTMTSGAIGLYAEVLRFAHDVPSAMLADTGEGALPSAQRMQTLLRQIVDAGNRLQSKRTNTLSVLFPVSDENYLSFQIEAKRAKAFLDTLVSAMETDTEFHIAVFLENPAELRPGGGFLGSYIDVVMKRGKIVRMDVHDVNDADRVFDRTIVPPKPLQQLVRNWRAADANWFFDFPTSAKKILEFLEGSHLYKDTGVTFGGAIGVSGLTLADVLGITGDIQLKDGTTITSSNALMKIQSLVQEGQAHSTGSGQAGNLAYPKEVLRNLVSALSKKMSELTDTQKQELLELAKHWIIKREVRAYAKEPAVENFLEHYGVAGTMFTIPQGFMGDYLAIDEANVGGGKSDLYMKERITLESQILEEGRVQNRLVIARTHTAPASASWWYREVSQSYMRIHTPFSASLTYASGITAKKIIPKMNYAKSDYERDADIVRVEATENADLQYPNVSVFKDAEKNIFAGWSRVAPGESSQFTLEYLAHLPAVPREGMAYQFIFDKQSGTASSYHFEIHAPVGFVFAETRSPVYEYDTTDAPGRVGITLTFARIAD